MTHLKKKQKLLFRISEGKTKYFSFSILTTVVCVTLEFESQALCRTSELLPIVQPALCCLLQRMASLGTERLEFGSTYYTILFSVLFTFLSLDFGLCQRRKLYFDWRIAGCKNVGLVIF